MINKILEIMSIADTILKVEGLDNDDKILLQQVKTQMMDYSEKYNQYSPIHDDPYMSARVNHELDTILESLKKTIKENNL